MSTIVNKRAAEIYAAAARSAKSNVALREFIDKLPGSDKLPKAAPGKTKVLER